jgi:general stress protein 26
MTIGRIDPRYGDAAATAPPWGDIERLLTDAQLYWIITVRTDGRPHAVPLVGVWHDGAFAFCTGPEEQKQRNLDANQHVAVTTGATGASGWNTGKDVVVEGTAVRVTEAEPLQALADAWYAKYGDDWRFEVRGDEPFRRKYRGRRPGLSGEARHGHRVRRRARPRPPTASETPHSAGEHPPASALPSSGADRVKYESPLADRLVDTWLGQIRKG